MQNLNETIRSAIADYRQGQHNEVLARRTELLDAAQASQDPRERVHNHVVATILLGLCAYRTGSIFDAIAQFQEVMAVAAGRVTSNETRRLGHFAQRNVAVAMARLALAMGPTDRAATLRSAGEQLLAATTQLRRLDQRPGANAHHLVLMLATYSLFMRAINEMGLARRAFVDLSTQYWTLKPAAADASAAFDLADPQSVPANRFELELADWMLYQLDDITVA